MRAYLILFLIVYVVALVMIAGRIVATRESKNARDFLFAGEGFAFWLSFFGVSATLFSTFTLQGMPAFFFNHGIGAWVFLGITDVCLAGILLWGGLQLRRAANHGVSIGAKNLTDLLKSREASGAIIWLYVLAATLFLLPYVTIQIKGVSVLLQASIPIAETHLAWSIIFVVVLGTYTWFGGIRGVYWTDALQGTVLFVVVWIVALVVLMRAGGIAELFDIVRTTRPALLSLPGPRGVLDTQFLVVSFIAICTMPYVQPQFATRVLVARSDRTLIAVSGGLAVFSFLVILPTMFIGLRAVGIAPDSGAEFLVEVLSMDAAPWLFALFIVGVIAAAMSTTDSQILAVGTEWVTAVRRDRIGTDWRSARLTKVVALGVMLVSLILAQSDFKSLVLFSINSFIGTSYLLPAIIGACRQSPARRGALYLTSFVCVLLFVGSLLGMVPTDLLGLRIELWLYLFSVIVIGFAVLAEPEKSEKPL